MPLAYLELKKQEDTFGIQKEIERLQKHFSEPYKKYFTIMQILSFSNNNPYTTYKEEPIFGSIYTTPNNGIQEYYYLKENPYYKESTFSKEDFKDILIDNHYNEDFEVNEDENTLCNKLISLIYNKKTLLNLIQNRITYDN